MLPDKKGFAALLLGKPKDGEEEVPESDDVGLSECAHQLIEAIHARNVSDVEEALRSAFQILESEPHEEAEHE